MILNVLLQEFLKSKGIRLKSHQKHVMAERIFLLQNKALPHSYFMLDVKNIHQIDLLELISYNIYMESYLLRKQMVAYCYDFTFYKTSRRLYKRV